jgi:hypothetical protein
MPAVRDAANRGRFRGERFSVVLTRTVGMRGPQTSERSQRKAAAAAAAAAAATEMKDEK